MNGCHVPERTLESARMNCDQFIAMSQQISVRPATSIDDLSCIAQLRYKGYGCFDSPASSLDDFDFATNCVLLIAEMPQRGIVGTLRMLEGTGGVELDRFVDLNSIEAVPGRSFVEATRLVVRRCREVLVIKALLCKAVWLYCLAQERAAIVVSSKDQTAEFYKFMQMQDVGERGTYLHSRLMNSLHRTYQLRVEAVPRLYDEVRHPYAELILRTQHDIRFSRMNVPGSICFS